MRIPDKNTLLEQGRDYLSCSLDLLATPSRSQSWWRDARR